MDKYDYIESIISYIGGKTGINYQIQIREVLSIYYKNKGKTYEMPDYYGGDRKNDGWVIEDAIFYQIYAPTRLKDSLKKEMQKKFSEDLQELLEIVCNKGEWGGKINEFFFIVNTFDVDLPQDSERFYDKKVKELKKKYNVEFRYKVVNTSYIRDVLTTIDELEILEQMSSVLRIRGMIDYNGITETVIIDMIIGISGNLNHRLMTVNAIKTYQRISTVRKIDINGLGSKKEEIDSIMSNLDVVERAISNINQDILYENKFERVKDYIIKKYETISTTYNGSELYEKLIDEMLAYTNEAWNLDMPMRFLIVYIFDKCDIFEKE